MKLDLSTVVLVPMQATDLDEVSTIEQTVYSHPWSRGNFVDALSQNYDAWVARSADGELLGYFVQMPVIDESHLLTLAVQSAAQGHGVARLLLMQLLCRASALQMLSVTLEVRVSNQRAVNVYQSAGFLTVGRRKGYYPTLSGSREDALIMQLMISR